MSGGVVISQPGKGAAQGGEPIAMQPMAMPNVMVPAGLPPGLAYLAGLDEIRIHQKLELLEVVVGWEKNNKYQVCNNQEQQFMFVKEDTSCLTRQFCGTARPFMMNISDNQGMNLIQLYRPFRCHATWYWCCCLQEMEIQSPPGMVIGQVKEIWTCMTPKYKVYDNNQQCLFTIVGECCYCKCCADVVFRVFDGDSEAQEIGQIIKHWSGCREIFGQANDFSVRFPGDMDIMKKALMFGSTFLIDFNYFEPRGN